MKINDERNTTMNQINPILRIFNKNFNNAIPFEIRQRLGLETGDLLSYSITGTGDVLIHKIPVEECVPPIIPDVQPDIDQIISLLSSLTPEQQAAANTYLSVKCKTNANKGERTT